VVFGGLFGRKKAHEERDPEQRLIELCGTDPEEVLRMLDSMSAADRESFRMRHIRFIALCGSALSNFRNRDVDLFKTDQDTLRASMPPDRMRQVMQALDQFADLERAFPDGLRDLNARTSISDDMINTVALVGQKLSPGEVQKRLGWTKLVYFGADPIFRGRGTLDAVEDDFWFEVCNARLSAPDIIGGAAILEQGEDEKARYLECALLKKPLTEDNASDLGNVIGRVKIYETGDVISA
jgi:hypothetical protein